MANKLKHIAPKSYSIWERFNELVDAVNQLRDDVEDLRAEKAKPAAKRAPKSTTSDKE